MKIKTKIKNLFIASSLFGAILFTPFSQANNNFINTLQHEWATAKYQTPRNQQDHVFQELMDKAEIYEAKHPRDAEAALWHGTILATYASIKGGMGALKYAEASRNSLEKAIQLKSNVEKGFAHAVLGSLYARVPGWPISFGSKSKAENHFKIALNLNPEGIDENFYYGKYLVENNQSKEAISYLQKGLNAKIRPEFEMADKGRKHELKALLTQAQEN